jgi:hypothetical protein
MMIIIVMKFTITVCTRFSIYNKGPTRLSYDNDGEVLISSCVASRHALLCPQPTPQVASPPEHLTPPLTFTSFAPLLVGHARFGIDLQKIKLQLKTEDPRSSEEL